MFCFHFTERMLSHAPDLSSEKMQVHIIKYTLLALVVMHVLLRTSVYSHVLGDRNRHLAT